MFKLLNRFAWILSILSWFFLLFLFWIAIDEMNGSYSSFLDDDFFFAWVLWSLFIWSIFKKIFLSQNFVEERVSFFAEALKIKGTKKTKEMIPNPRDIISEPSNVTSIMDIPESIAMEEKKDIKVKKINEVQHAEYSESTFDKEKSKIEIYIKKFFQENLLAKIGAILVFFSVVFLMSLVWNQFNAVWKIIIWFTIWFGIFWTWVILDKRWFIWESRILLWTWILINFLVILAWKYLIGDNYGSMDTIPEWILSTWITFLFLILNTVFWVVTSLLYKSRTLLLFSFIFAYLNPLIVWGNSETPFVLLWYSMIVSLWALFLGIKQNDIILKYSAFVLWNLLFLIAPFGWEVEWITKLLSSGFLWFISIISLYKKNPELILSIFILNYIFIILLLISGSDISILWGSMSFISYMTSILLFFWVWVWLFTLQSIKSITPLLLFPILIVIWLIFSGSVFFIAPAIAILVLTYLIAFQFLESFLAPVFKYFFFWSLGWFLLLSNSYLSYHLVDISFSSFFTVIIVSFIFIFTSYYLSRKEKLEFLYSIWTLWWILTLAPILVVWTQNDTLSQNFEMLSIISVIIFSIVNLVLPFINKNLISKTSNVKNLVTWSIFGVLFIGFELFNYWTQYFPGISLWFAFVALAVIYFVISYLMVTKLWIENVKKEWASKNTILSYLFISISLFSLAISLVFSWHAEIISTVWLFEASILFYFYSTTKEIKIFSVWIILFMIWIIKLFELGNIVEKWDFIFLVPFTIIFSSLICNIKFLNFIKDGVERYIHDIFHILWIWVLWFLLIEIIPSTWHGWSILGISIFLFIIWSVYAYFHSKILKMFFIVIVWLFSIAHIGDTSQVINKIDQDEIGYLRILQYFSTAIIASSVLVWNKFNTEKLLANILKIFISLYILAIISFYIYDIFNTTFAITIFWWLVSSGLLLHWISRDIKKIRTIWLYLLSLVLAKIFLYDLWYGLDDAVTRVVAFMVIWVLLIIISTQYSKKYGNNLLGEFHYKNLD